MNFHHSSTYNEDEISQSNYSRPIVRKQPSNPGTGSPSPSDNNMMPGSELENILTKKESELAQVNSLRIKTLENIIEEKIKMIESLEVQLSLKPTNTNLRDSASRTENEKKYKERATKYKNLLRERDH